MTDEKTKEDLKALAEFNRYFSPGDRVQHFKRELKSKNELKERPDLCLYEIVDIATHSETDEPLVIYKALYMENREGNHPLFARPVSLFMSEVDHKKYTNIKQKYRFEKI